MTVKALDGVAKAGPWTCDGEQVDFGFEFEVLDAGDIAVYVNDVEVDEYSVTLTEDGAKGGTVTMDEAPDSGAALAIIRDIELSQETDFQNGNAFLPEIQERIADKITMRLQQHWEAISRCIKVGVTTDDDVDGYIETLMEASAAAVAAAATAQEVAENSIEHDIPTHNAATDAHEEMLDNREDTHNADVTTHSALLHHVCQGRLTLASGDPCPTANVSDVQTVYFTPYNGNTLMLYDVTSEKWIPRTFIEKAIDISTLVASTNFDVFVYWDSTNSTMAFEVLAWSDDVTRATDLTYQDGVKVKTGAPARLYIGTIRTTSTAGYTSDNINQRFIWNYYNQIPQLVATENPNTSWTYAYGGARREYNAGSGQTHGEFVIGDTVTVIGDSYSLISGVGLAYSTIYRDNTAYDLYITKEQDSLIQYILNSTQKLSLGYAYLTQEERATGSSIDLLTYGEGHGAQALIN